jgi:hypothetical protein
VPVQQGVPGDQKRKKKEKKECVSHTVRRYNKEYQETKNNVMGDYAAAQVK